LSRVAASLINLKIMAKFVARIVSRSKLSVSTGKAMVKSMAKTAENRKNALRSSCAAKSMAQKIAKSVRVSASKSRSESKANGTPNSMFKGMCKSMTNITPQRIPTCMPLCRRPVKEAISKQPPRSVRKFTKHGQNIPSGQYCVATTLQGRPCARFRISRGVPYCSHCASKGDPSLRVKDHPKFGKILIAARDLPRGYYAGWWGDVRSKKQMTRKAMEWALETSTIPMKYIDATPHMGSQLQFSACPGPNEVATINFCGNFDCILDVKEPKTSLLFSTLREIPKDHQITMMYNKDEQSTDEFFRALGICRADVGTPRYPAIRKPIVGQA